jgi:hypothetical protein
VIRRRNADSPTGYDTGQELDHLDRMISLGIEKVQSIPLFADTGGIPSVVSAYLSFVPQAVAQPFSVRKNRPQHSLVRVMLQDQLLEEQERPLVRDLLPDLDGRLPRILRGQLCTSRTLPSLHHQREDKRLLQHGIRQHLFLNRNLDFDTSRVRLGPYESGVDQPDFEQGASDLLQADSWASAPLEQGDIPSSSRDSGWTGTQEEGGDKNFSHPLQKLTEDSLGIPSVISMLSSVGSRNDHIRIPQTSDTWKVSVGDQASDGVTHRDQLHWQTR